MTTHKDLAITELHLPLLIAKHYDHDQGWQQKSGDNSVIQSPNEMLLRIGSGSYRLTAQIELDVDTAGDWDTTAGTNYSTAANRAGLDFYVYAVQPVSGSVPEFKLSVNSTVPSGYTADNSRKVSGFHCLCVAVGTIAGHTLTGYLQGDILPTTVWDLFHRPNTDSGGMWWCEGDSAWWSIYNLSDDGAGGVQSVYNATILDTISWLDLCDRLAKVKMHMPGDADFAIAAEGSNEETNIAGSADPVTAGGHSDTAGRRMISNGGAEGMCGAMWQWLSTPSARLDDGTAAGWYDLPGAKGSLYTYGTNKYANTQLRAGGHWTTGAHCGSRSRLAGGSRWPAAADVGARGRSEPRAHRFL